MNASRHTGPSQSASHELQPINNSLSSEPATINHEIAHKAILAQCRYNVIESQSHRDKCKDLLGRSILHGDPLRIELQIRRTPDYGNTGESVRIMKVTIKDLSARARGRLRCLRTMSSFSRRVGYGGVMLEQSFGG